MAAGALSAHTWLELSPLGAEVHHLTDGSLHAGRNHQQTVCLLPRRQVKWILHTIMQMSAVRAPGEGRVDLEGEASFTLLPSHENTETKTNDSVYSLPSNPATWNAEKKSFCREKSVSEALNRWKTKVFVIMCHRVSVKTDLSSNIKCWNQFFAGISSCAVSICVFECFTPSGGLASRADILLKASLCTSHREQLSVKRN